MNVTLGSAWGIYDTLFCEVHILDDFFVLFSKSITHLNILASNKYIVCKEIPCYCASVVSNRSRKTSKCGKNKKVAHKAIGECVTDVLYGILTCSVITEQMHGIMESICVM